MVRSDSRMQQGGVHMVREKTIATAAGTGLDLGLSLA